MKGSPASRFRNELIRRLSLVLVALAVSVSVTVHHQSRPSRLTAAPAAFSVYSGAKNIISIRGDVQHPGVYCFSDNALTIDVIKMAVPIATVLSWAPKGSEAALLNSGNEVTVLIKPSGEGVLTVKPLQSSHRIVLGIPLDINRMTTADFVVLPGIGPALAERIIAFRHKNGGFMQVKDLQSIAGIGDKKYKQLEKHF